MCFLRDLDIDFFLLLNYFMSFFIETQKKLCDEGFGTNYLTILSENRIEIIYVYMIFMYIFIKPRQMNTNIFFPYSAIILFGFSMRHLCEWYTVFAFRLIFD